MLYRSKIDCIDKIRFEIRPFHSSPSFILFEKTFDNDHN